MHLTFSTFKKENAVRKEIFKFLTKIVALSREGGSLPFLMVMTLKMIENDWF